MTTVQDTNRLHQEVIEQFRNELIRIGKYHFSRQAILAQSTLHYLDKMALTVPKLAGECHKIMRTANPYTGEYWTNQPKF